MKFRKQKDPGVYHVARKRARALSTSDLYNWTDALIFGMGKNLDFWRRGFGDAALKESEVAALQMLEVIRELRSRENVK